MNESNYLKTIWIIIRKSNFLGNQTPQIRQVKERTMDEQWNDDRKCLNISRSNFYFLSEKKPLIQRLKWDEIKKIIIWIDPTWNQIKRMLNTK